MRSRCKGIFRRNQFFGVTLRCAGLALPAERIKSELRSSLTSTETMQLMRTPLKCLLVTAAALVNVLLWQTTALAQAGLRDSLLKLDRNEDGRIDPDEITPLARPYLERIARAKRLSLDRPNGIEEWQEAARIHHARMNGMSRDEFDIDRRGPTAFGLDDDQPMVPDFGLAEVRYPYTRDDLRTAERTLRRLDRNEDGFLDRREARRGEWRRRDPFNEDYNNDGLLSRLELAQRYARRRLLEGSAGELIKKAVRVGNGIRPANRDGDSRNRRRSWWRDRYKLSATILSRFDEDRNGQLDPSEIVALGISPSRIDANRDGVLTRNELTAYTDVLEEEAGKLEAGLPSWFFERDLDEDDQVSMAEFTSDWSEEKIAEFRRLDRNGDGLLTIAEASMAKSLIGGRFSNRDAEPLAPGKTMISELEVDEQITIADLDVQLSITHTHTDHLDGFLIGPDEQRIELFTAVGRHDDHFDNTIFDDSASTSIDRGRPPFDGEFAPEAVRKRQPSLSHWNGKNARGTWQLVISNKRGDRFGMLHGWGLIIESQ